jgi:hypothetical protein
MSSNEPGSAAEELARKAARLLRHGRPAIEKAVADNRPRVERAAKDALRYAQEHEDEIKRTALKAARVQVRGPFGFLFDAVNSGLRDGPAPSAAPGACPACEAPNPVSARFCSQCGTRLTHVAGDQKL